MDPIRVGDRGPAVEDVQRRLLMLGHDLGRTGVDGVFMGRTAEAVRAFQAERGLGGDGEVDDGTWAALVDASFSLGDRMVYLRHPFFHGADVRTLQSALAVLGFAAGEVDGIFGRSTELAVREFQAGCGQPPDGIVGPETVAALMGLRHVWEGKDPTGFPGPVAARSRCAEVPPGLRVSVVVTDGALGGIAARIANLASASEATSRFHVEETAVGGAGDRLIVALARAGVHYGESDLRLEGVPDGASSQALAACLAAVADRPPVVVFEVPAEALSGDRAAQRFAVALLDAVCGALA